MLLVAADGSAAGAEPDASLPPTPAAVERNLRRMHAALLVIAITVTNTIPADPAPVVVAPARCTPLSQLTALAAAREAASAPA